MWWEGVSTRQIQRHRGQGPLLQFFFFWGGDVCSCKCRIADEIRSCNLFPLPGPLGKCVLLCTTTDMAQASFSTGSRPHLLPVGVPEGVGNLFFGDVVIRGYRQCLPPHPGTLKRIFMVSLPSNRVLMLSSPGCSRIVNPSCRFGCTDSSCSRSAGQCMR